MEDLMNVMIHPDLRDPVVPVSGNEVYQLCEDIVCSRPPISTSGCLLRCSPLMKFSTSRDKRANPALLVRRVPNSLKP